MKEYRVLSLYSRYDLEGELNRRAKGGWRTISISYYPPTDVWIITLEREQIVNMDDWDDDHATKC